MTPPLTPRLFALTAAAMAVMVGASQALTHYGPTMRDFLLACPPWMVVAGTCLYSLTGIALINLVWGKR